MFKLRLLSYFLLILFFVPAQISATYGVHEVCQDLDVLLEIKGAYFLSTDKTFKSIYNNGSGIYGAELTGKVHNNWYGFASADFLSKCGHTCALNSPTKVNIANLGFGVKYFEKFCYGDFYVGLGILPTYLRTQDYSPFVPCENSKWGCGGIAKIGAYFDLPHSFFVDLFFNYSFVKINFKSSCPKILEACKVNLNGCWFGAGLGYRFN